MRHLNLLAVTFDTNIKPYETAAFRGAVVEKIGAEHEYYHNHNNGEEAPHAFHNRYALIQYKRNRRRPMIVFIDKGVEEARHFFAQQEWELTFAGRHHHLPVYDMKVKPYEIGVADQPVLYRINQWIALNQKNYQIYQELDNLADRLKFLERKLAAHIIAFADGIDWFIEERFEVAIVKAVREETVKCRGVKMLAFSLVFRANLLLPPYIGLGKGASLGFGVIRKEHPPKRESIKL